MVAFHYLDIVYSVNNIEVKIDLAKTSLYTQSQELLVHQRYRDTITYLEHHYLKQIQSNLEVEKFFNIVGLFTI